MKLKIGLFVFALSLIALVYWQGLGGLFMLDDVANLQLLADTIHQEGFWAGVWGGHSGPTGRPVSLFTFAVQLSSWPNDPASFKLVNILIHLINSVLMMVIVYWLLPHLFSVPNHYRFPVAILLSAYWALLPIQVSTVLYVVQRMVLLSSLFMLLAIVFYAWARRELYREHQVRAGVIFCLGVGVGSILAILAKESGLLVFAFLIVIEVLVQDKQPVPNTKIRYCLMFVLLLPLILFVAYIIYKGTYQHYDGRTFNLAERVLTQPRVLLDYVQQIILPVQSQLGLYHDDYLKSTSWLNPISTLWAIIFWVVFFVIAIWHKSTCKPWIFFAFFWFVSGHLMESTVLPLELYFEHRNYLSSMGILVGFIGLCVMGYSLIKSESIQNLVRLGAVVYLCLLISVTVSHAGLWGNKGEYMVVSAKENPTSLRARMLMIDYYDATGSSEQANKEIHNISRDFPNEIAIRFSQIHYACKNNLYSLELKISEDDLRFGRFSNATESTLLKIIDLKKEKSCQNVSYEYLLYLIDGILNNVNYLQVKHRFLRVKSVVLFELNQYLEAIRVIESLAYKDFSDRLGLIVLYSRANDFEKSEDLIKIIRNEKLTDYQEKRLNEIKKQIEILKQKGK